MPVRVNKELEGDQYHVLISRISKVYEFGNRTWSRNATSVIHPLTDSTCGCHGGRNVTYDHFNFHSQPPLSPRTLAHNETRCCSDFHIWKVLGGGGALSGLKRLTYDSVVYFYFRYPLAKRAAHH